LRAGAGKEFLAREIYLTVKSSSGASKNISTGRQNIREAISRKIRKTDARNPRGTYLGHSASLDLFPLKRHPPQTPFFPPQNPMRNAALKTHGRLCKNKIFLFGSLKTTNERTA
jgi:hypothetical protein